MEKQEVLNAIKDNLETARLLAEENAALIGNSHMHIHIGSIMKKWLGGIGTNPVYVQEESPRLSQKVFTPTKEHFKKKDLQEKRHVAINEDETLSKLSLSELKIEAKNLGINIKERDRKQLIEDIKFIKQGQRADEIQQVAKNNDEEE